MSHAKRNSNIEMLKIFAIILIIFSHAMPVHSGDAAWNMDLGLATNSVQRLLIVFMKYGGQIGNALFLIPSVWFLSDSTKVDAKKVISLVIDGWIISVGSLLGFSLLGVDVPVKVMIRQFFPLLFNAAWFLCCYICYYLIHPFINKLTASMSQKNLLYCAGTMAVIYCGVNTLVNGTYYSTDLVSFIAIHIIVTYIKRYLPDMCKNVRLNICGLVASGVCLIALVLFTNYLGLRISFFSHQLTKWNTFKNPLILIFTMCAFNLANRKTSYNRVVNYISSMSLLIYIIHCNRIVIDYVMDDLFHWIYEHYTYSHELVWVLLVGVGMCVYGTVVSLIYKETIQRLTRKISLKICDYFNNSPKLISKVENFLMRIK